MFINFSYWILVIPKKFKGWPIGWVRYIHKKRQEIFRHFLGVGFATTPPHDPSTDRDCLFPSPLGFRTTWLPNPPETFDIYVVAYLFPRLPVIPPEVRCLIGVFFGGRKKPPHQVFWKPRESETLGRSKKKQAKKTYGEVGVQHT